MHCHASSGISTCSAKSLLFPLDVSLQKSLKDSCLWAGHNMGNCWLWSIRHHLGRRNIECKESTAQILLKKLQWRIGTGKWRRRESKFKFSVCQGTAMPASAFPCSIAYNTHGYSKWDRWPAGTTALTSSAASYCRVFCFDAASYCKTPASSAPRCMNLGSTERESWSSSSGWRITKLLWDLHSLLPERKEISLQWWCFPLSNW